MKPTWKGKGLATVTLSCIAGFSGQMAKAGMIITPYFDDSVTGAQQTVITHLL